MFYFIFILQSYIYYDHLDTTLVLFSSMLIEFLLLRLWNSRYHLFWLRSMLSYVITLPSIKFLCIVVCSSFYLGFSPCCCQFSFDLWLLITPPPPIPGNDSSSYWRFPKIQKKSFRKNYSEIYTTDYSFGKTSERLVRQPLDNSKSRGTFEKALQK